MIFRNMKKWLIIKMKLMNIRKPLIWDGTYRYLVLVFNQRRSFKESLKFTILALTGYTGDETSLLLIFLESRSEETVSQRHLDIGLKKANCLLRRNNLVLFTNNWILEPGFFKTHSESHIVSLYPQESHDS